MTTVKITQLPAITGANADAADVIPLVDVSLNTTNKITRQEFFNNIPSATVVGDFFIADKIVHNGDTNTSIRFPAADTVTVETSGAERLRIDSSGNVGIGTTPSYKLHVLGDARVQQGNYVDPILYISQSAITSGNKGQIQFTDSSGTTASITAYGSAFGSGNNYAMAFSTNAAERMRIDSSGNLAVGTTNASSRLTVTGGGSSLGGTARFNAEIVEENLSAKRGVLLGFDNTSQIGIIGANSGGLASNLAFWTWNGSAWGERVRITSSGNLLVGTTSSAGAGGTTIQPAYIVTNVSVSTLQDHISFRNTNGEVGKISTNGTATTYATSSDYRLKEDLQPIADAASRLALLNPVNFAWKADGSRTDGFIAHEVQEVVPQAVTGEKDAVDADGNPQYQGIDHSKLVPLLTAALQEALTKIEALEARIIALEA